jgi:hypothetical protein
MNPSKSERIDRWRQEVALATTDTTPATDATLPSQPPRRSSRASFFSKLLKNKSNGISDRQEEFESTAMYEPMEGGDEARSGSGTRAAGQKGEGKDQGRGQDESMVIADMSMSISPEGGLVAKRERLERAARLLGKGGAREGKG